ncbi:hypothetical protein Vadar_026866 [Vaccinium darrowii]|uniref:Uncharacterized protein n=1 Tax=Vaccinium darrowii TaxID=229202 RepID=A0ACB7XV20_9ERIC|nr:hypothetical protein Vadar_026866 [Vaccinium darrowii]
MIYLSTAQVVPSGTSDKYCSSEGLDEMKMELEGSMAVIEEEGRREIEKKKNEEELGGVKTLPFIIANEISERFATEGFHGNMITYLTLELNLPLW